MATMVCRVTPTRAAKSFCVISSASNRKRRMVLVILILLTR
jgi:hypothetical protein